MKSLKAYFVVETDRLGCRYAAAKTGHNRLSREYQDVTLLEEILPAVDGSTGN